MNSLVLKLYGKTEIPWEEIKELISSACEYNNPRTSADDYREDLESGRKQLWLALEISRLDDEISSSNHAILGLAVTSIEDYRRLRCCSIYICTGKQMNKWLHFIYEIEKWAHEQGCKRMINYARPGFERLINGYTKTHIILEKDL
jgi:hypothetical protein